MDTLELLRNYIDERTGKLNDLPDIVTKGIDALPKSINFNLKLAITLSELITLASHLRKPIELYDGTLVPTNAIVFALSGSGTNKDKSLNTIRKSLSKVYEELEEARIEYAEERAKKLAVLEGDVKENWLDHYSQPNPLQSGLGTVEGLVQHFSELSQNPLGAGSLLSTEIVGDLQTNGSMQDIVKTLSVAYDLGNIPPKTIKDTERQTPAVNGLPINALFFGSQDALLFDNELKSKFKLMFNTQLARRSIFSFTPEKPERLHITSIDQLYAFKEKEREDTLQAQIELSKLTSGLVGDTSRTPLKIEPEANKLFDVYLEYNLIVSDEGYRKYNMSNLSRKHKQWLALKLAGVYAILDRSEVITEELYAYAINTLELLSEALRRFEKELAKEPYEVLAHYCREMAEEGVFSISLHELRKLEYVTGSGTPKLKVQDLASLAASYDNDAIYTVKDDGIEYRELTKTSIKGTSYITFDTEREGEELKTYMEEHCDKGYKHIESTFEELADLLESNAAYTPFKFKNGKRNRENLEGGCSWLALDVDKSCLTDKEVHILLSEYKHHIARTSNPDNEYKFRVLIELDTLVEIDRELWKHFIQEVGNLLGLIIDPLAQSQIFFSYEGREILSQMDADPLESKPLIDKAIQTINSKPKKPRKLSKVQRSDLLEAPDDTFNFAFTAENGEGSRQVYRALAYAIDLGADEEYVRNLAHEINNYWHTSMPEERLERTLIIPILRRLTQCPG